MLEKLDTLIAFAVVMLGVSLIITILTQIVSTFLGLRGSNLLWGLETLLNELDPNLKDHLAAAVPNLDVREFAAQVLTDPKISDSTFSRAEKMWGVGWLVGLVSKIPYVRSMIRRWRYATAIGFEELARVLEERAAGFGAPGGVAAPGTPGAEVAAALNALLTAPDPEVNRKLQRLNTALAAFVPPAPAVPGGPAPNFSVQVDKVFQQATDAVQQSVGKLETWFNSVMDRVSQRFAAELRIWTVIFAFALCFGAHLDSFHLLDQLSTNGDVRNSLVSLRNGMMSDANTILPSVAAGAPANSEVPVSTDILNEALGHLPAGTVPPGTKIPENITTVTDAVAWLTSQPGVKQPIDGPYRQAVINVLRVHAVDIDQKLASTGFDLIASPYPGLVNFSGVRNILGIVVAAALLSLGAPFWYNALKNLSNLRTAVASKQDS